MLSHIIIGVKLLLIACLLDNSMGFWNKFLEHLNKNKHHQRQQSGKCNSPLGMQNRRIPDTSIIASSMRQKRPPANGRLNIGRDVAWCYDYDKAPWLQVDFAKPVKVTKIATQGLNQHWRSVLRFYLSYSQDPIDFTRYRNGQMFHNGPDARITTNQISPPIIARYIRICPSAPSVPQPKNRDCIKVEFYGCVSGFTAPKVPACRNILGLQNKLIKDAAVTASSSYNNGFPPENARLRYVLDRSYLKFGWKPVYGVKWPWGWLQVVFGKWTMVSGIATMGGRYRRRDYVKSYTISFSYDTVEFQAYKRNGRPAVFSGNMDNIRVVYNDIKPAIIANAIRILPKTWEPGDYALRIELYGCNKGFQIPTGAACDQPLGLQAGRATIPNKAFSASSSLFPPYGARLNNKASPTKHGCWRPSNLNEHQWLQVDLGTVTRVTGIATQGGYSHGRGSSYITEYSLSYSMDGQRFTPYNRRFRGNNNHNVVVVNRFRDKPILARFIRIHPLQWYYHIGLRVELLGCKGDIPLLNTPTITKSSSGGSGARCSWKLQKNPMVSASSHVQYQVQWIQNGAAKPVTGAESNQKGANLKCGVKGFKAGDKVACKVRARYQGKKLWGPYMISSDFRTGVTLDPAAITVSEASRAETVKVCTDMALCCDDPEKEECQVALEFDHMDDIITNKCLIVFKPGQRCTAFKVKAVRDFLDDGNKQIELKFKPVNAPNCPCWHGYKPPSVTVHTQDAAHSTCTSTTDPHVKTFDGRSFHHLQGGGGTFLFIKSLVRPFEVHVKLWPCMRVLCNCGVAVREGSDVLVYDQCSGVPRVVKKSPGPLTKGVSITRRGAMYKLAFRSGAEIEIKGYSWGINLYAKVPGMDKGKTIGQCGNNNGRPSDDMDGKGEYDWLRSIRIPPNKDLFSQATPPSNGATDENFKCECKREMGLAYQHCDVRHTGEQKGTPVDPFPSNGGGIVPPFLGNLLGASRWDEAFKMERRTLSKSPWPSPSGLTLARVVNECRRVLEWSKTGKACKAIGLDIKHIIIDCVIDIRFADSLKFTRPSFDALVEECKDKVLRNPANYKGNSHMPSTPLLDVLCPGDCSGHGTCKKRKCTCDSGFYENDCSKDITKPPVLKSMLAVCDVRKWPCKKIAIVGDGYVDTDMLSCHMSKFVLQNNKWVAKDSPKSPSTYSSFREVLCELPITYSAGRKFPGPMKIEIKISNDGKAKSNAKTLVVFDSRCFNCKDNGACERKEGNCVIENVCYEARAKNPSNAELVCDPSKSTDSWHDTRVKPTTAAPTPPPTKAPTQAPTTFSLTVIYNRIGCYNDAWFRAMPKYLGYVNGVDACFMKAKSRNFKAFGVQNKHECWSGARAEKTYSLYGESRKCRNGLGGSWANDVYMIQLEGATHAPVVEYKSILIGCFKDARDRSLPRYLGRVNSAGLCNTLARDKGFEMFAVQNGHECWSGPTGVKKTYKKHGVSKKCKNGLGGRWANSVYRIKVKA